MIIKFNYGHLFYSSVIAMAVTATTSFNMDSTKMRDKSNLLDLQSAGNELSSLKRADAWLNSEPLTAPDLKGKIVLVQFWTYTCINWIRTLPYIRAWAEKYKDKGLVVIGVHTPEFPFEKDSANVRWATKAMNIDFPIAIDNRSDIWDAFNNSYWPALYFIDAKGRIRHFQFGEGEYERSEKVIQQLLGELMSFEVGHDLVSVNPRGIEISADWTSLNSAENYLGYERTENFTGGRLRYDKQHDYKAPADLNVNHWSLSGLWTVDNRSIRLNSAKGKIIYRFQARDLHIVMGPVLPGTAVRFRVLINGKPPVEAQGIDVDEQGYGTVREQRMYQLIRQAGAVSDLLFEIQFFDAGVEAFAFTFG